MYLAETDFRAGRGLAFTRHYNTDSTSGSTAGNFWRHTYSRSIDYYDAAPTSVIIRHEDGKSIAFALSGGNWTGDSNIQDRLTEQVDGSGYPLGWTHFRADSRSVEQYDATGKLLSVTDENGLVTSLTYSTASTPVTVAPWPDLLVTVSDPIGRTLQLTYTNKGNLATVSDPSGQLYQYGIDETGSSNLLTVTSPGTTHPRTYVYNEQLHTQNANFPSALTSVKDENAGPTPYTTIDYDATGNAISTQHANGADKFTLSYPSDGSSDVTDPNGHASHHTFAIVNGVVRAATVSGPSVGFTVAARQYDSSGNTTVSTDFNNVSTCYTFDQVNDLETSRTEGVTGSCTPTPVGVRTVQTDWDTNLRRPTERRVLNASGTLEARTKWVYTNGRLTARCEIDPAISGAGTYTCGSSTNAPAGVRQYTTAYCLSAGSCGLVGLVTSTNGPRLTTEAGMGGLDDIVTYAYYTSDDATCATGGACPHRKGDLWKVTNALSHVTEYISYDKNGRVTRIKDANATYTDFVYHARGWLTQRFVRANSAGTPSVDDAKLQMDYDAVGNVTQVTQPDGSFLHYTYDDAHRLIKINDNLTNAIDYCPGGVLSANCLDHAGNRKIEYVKDASLTVTRQLFRTYNQLGRLTQVLNAASAPVERSDGLTDTGVADGYDGNGNRVLKQDGLGVQTKQEFDPLNRLKTTIQNYNNFGADPATYHTTTGYLYDTRDNLRQVTDPDGLNTVYTYDGLNDLTNLSSPDTGGTAYGYDKAGNRVSQTDNRVPSVTSTYTYDALNRLTAIAYPTSSLNVTYAYDQADAVTGCSGSFPKGRLTRMTDTSGSTTYCYDRRGNVLKKTQVTDATNLITQYTYTTADKVDTIAYPSGAIVTYAPRDEVGRIKTITWKANAGAAAITLVSNATYYPFGPLNVLTFGNGRTLTKTYDKDYAIDSISGTPAGALTLDFGVDVMGDITSASGTISPPNPDRSYQYDPLYRLSTAKTGVTPLEAYTYNKTGDRLSASLNGGAAQVYTYAIGTHRVASVGGAARTSDPNGNLTSVPASTFPLVYDDRNRLVQAKTTGLGSPNVYNYTYNGSGERVLKYAGTSAGDIYEASVWDAPGRLLSIHARAAGGSSGSFGAAAVTVNATWDEIIYLDSTPVGLARDGVVYYIEADHLGTPRQVIERARNVAVWKWDSLSNTFGTTAPSQDPDLDGTQLVFNLRYPGQYYDAETGLNYNYFRDYDPAIGRYAESDPIGLAGGVNTYSYVLGDPIGSIDPQGQLSGSLAKALARGVLVDAAGGGPLDPVGDVCAIVVGVAVLADEIAKEANRQEVHRICDETPPPNLNPCELARWKLTKALRCQRVRTEMSNKWFGGTYEPGHDQQMTQLQREIDNLRRIVDRECGPCPSCK
jgi:RHS repeat-associated protein